MFLWLVRTLKRLLVLAVGLAVIYLAVWEFFPFFDNRTPLALALLATYVFTAYFFIPALIRLYRLFIRPNHIPTYCVTPDGFASDPVNIGIVGTRKQLIFAMTDAGWHMADRRTIKTGLRYVISILLDRPYPNAPFSKLFLFGRSQDIGFQLPVIDNPSHRHHVRFWACHLEGLEEFHGHVRFWQRFHKPMLIDDKRQLWVGAASKDIGIIPIRHNAQLTHMVDPDTNSERDLIVKDLKTAKAVVRTKTVKIGAPYRLRNRTLGGFLHADGKMKICFLKD